MVIDTSAIIAILLREPDAPLFAEAIENGTPRLMSAATLLEASMVMYPFTSPPIAGVARGIVLTI
jgi:ribonuclease VapC